MILTIAKPICSLDFPETMLLLPIFGCNLQACGLSCSAMFRLTPDSTTTVARWLRTCSCCLFGAILLVTSAFAKEPKVLLIGIDGVRPDALIVADTPNINRLIAEGTFDPTCQILGERYRESNTVSGASWSSILTGVWADKHGVHDNSFEGKNYTEYPHYFVRIKDHLPEAETVSLVSVWNPIDRHIVEKADVREFFPLYGGRTTSLNVPAGVDTRDGNWHHLAGVRRGETIYLYLNGTEVGRMLDGSGDFSLEGAAYYLGGDAREGGIRFNGELRGVHIWDRALNEADILALTEGGDAPAEDLLLSRETVLEKERLELEEPLKSVTHGDFTLAAHFRTTDERRNILMGNYGDADRGHLNLELHRDNHVRLYLNPPRQDRYQRMISEEITDSAVTDRTVELLGNSDPTALWVYLHQPDAAGHRFDFCPKSEVYMDAIETVDGHIGRIMDAVRARPNYDDEDWLVLMVTDHGGLGRRHGGGHDNPEILTGFLLVSGEAAYNRISPQRSTIVDVVPTILTHLGIPLDPELDGQPIGLRN